MLVVAMQCMLMVRQEEDEKQKNGRASGLMVIVSHLGSLASDSTRQLDVFGHDGNTFGVNGAQIGVLEEADQVTEKQQSALDAAVND